MSFLDKLANKFAPISNEKAVEIIRSNLGLIESLTLKYIQNNGSTENITLNGTSSNKSKNEPNTFEKTLLRANEAYPEFMLTKPHYFVACYIFHMYANPNLDKETKKQFSNYLSNAIFSTFVDKACSNLWNDVGKLLSIPRTYQQQLDQERVFYNFDDIMIEYSYVIEGRSLDNRSADLQEVATQRKRKK